MPEVHIKLDLPPFKDAFVWEDSEEEFHKLVGSQCARMSALGDPEEVSLAYTHAAIDILRKGDADPITDRSARIALVAFALQLKISQQDGSPLHRLIDYLPVHDLEVTIRKFEDGQVLKVEVCGEPRIATA